MTRQETGGGEFQLTDDEKQQLLDTMNDMDDVNEKQQEVVAAKKKLK